MNAREAEAPDLRDYLRLLWRRGWILVLCVTLIPVGTYLYTNGLEKVFRSSAVLQVQSTALDSPLLTSQDFTLPQGNIHAVARFVSTSGVAEEAARQLGESRSLLGAATASADPETGFITITASSFSAQRAADIANAFAEALSITREKRARRRVDSAIRGIQQDLQRIPRSNEVARNQLSEQLQRLRALRAAQAQNAQVLEPAQPGQQIAPNPERNATVALILALLIGAGLIVLVERMDRRLRQPEDLERLTGGGQPLLATIPSDAFPGGRPSAHVAEAFQTLRDSLIYFNVDEELKSLAVMSGLKGEGKTTVATNLAVSFARAGKRVILVDADLRKPDVASRMGIDDSIGLSQVLVGMDPQEALQEAGGRGPGLRVMPAGPTPPNPSALLGSKRMSTLLAELSEDADLVIIDTTPLLVVSDAFPLLEQVSGAIALARLDKAPRDAVRRMLKITSTAGGRVLGMVATGAKSGGRYGYGYGYGYGYVDAGEQPSRFGTPLPSAPASNGGEPATIHGPEHTTGRRDAVAAAAPEPKRRFAQHQPRSIRPEPVLLSPEPAETGDAPAVSEPRDDAPEPPEAHESPAPRPTRRFFRRN